MWALIGYIHTHPTDEKACVGSDAYVLKLLCKVVFWHCCLGSLEHEQCRVPWGAFYTLADTSAWFFVMYCLFSSICNLMSPNSSCDAIK